MTRPIAEKERPRTRTPAPSFSGVFVDTDPSGRMVSVIAMHQGQTIVVPLDHERFVALRDAITEGLHERTIDVGKS